MNILITAGGTSEAIDDVRAITNTSTGKLGTEIAAAFLENNEQHRIHYLCGKNSLKPRPHASLTLTEIGSVADLQHHLTDLLARTPFDAVIHSMAVSDYQMNAAFPEDDLIAALANELASDANDEAEIIDLTNPSFWSLRLKEALQKISPPTQAGKISSASEHLYLSLKKAPKVIQLIKKQQPETILVGFKLLSNASEEALLAAAKASIQTNGCDFVLANDLSHIQREQHHAILVGQSGSTKTATTKKDIAALIVHEVTSQHERK